MISLRIYDSILAHYRNFLLRHFQITSWGRNIKKLHNKYEGKRCFIIGNGPSLTPDDLDKIKNEYSFGFNRIYYIFDKTEWRPTFYCTQDLKFAKAAKHEIAKNITNKYLFAPINFKWFERINIDSCYLFNAKYAGFNTPVYSDNPAAYIGVGNTVAFTAIQLATFMGFKEIYLLGVDHSFKSYQNENGEIVFDSSAKDYFYNDTKNKPEDLFVPKLDLSTLAYLTAKKYSEDNSINIYNATRGGKLEVFPRINFDSLF